MPVEPPVDEPALDLADAYAVLAEAPTRPIAGGTDLMVALTGELGEPPARILDLWRLDELRGIAVDGDARRPRRADDLHRDPPLGALSRAPAGAGRGGRDDRRGPDPEPRHARRQRRERLAGRRHAAGPARGRRVVRARLGARRADGRGAATSGRPTGGPPSRRTSSCSGSGIPLRPAARCASARSARGAPSRSARSCMALGWRDGRPDALQAPAAGRDVRLALGSVAATPIRAAATEAVARGHAHPTPETADRAAETLAGELAADRRRPLDRRVPAARRRAGPPSAHPRGRRLVMRDRRSTGPVGAPGGRRSTTSTPSRRAFAAAVAPLFEGAPRFLGRLATAAAVRHRRTRCSTRARDDRPRDAARRADRADRRASAARRAAGDGVARCRSSSRATRATRPSAAPPTSRAARDRRPSSTGSTPRTRHGSGSATASSWPAGRARSCCPGCAAALDADRDGRDPPGPRRGRRHRHATAYARDGDGRAREEATR